MPWRYFVILTRTARDGSVRDLVLGSFDDEDDADDLFDEEERFVHPTQDCCPRCLEHNKRARMLICACFGVRKALNNNPKEELWICFVWQTRPHAARGGA